MNSYSESTGSISDFSFCVDYLNPLQSPAPSNDADDNNASDDDQYSAAFAHYNSSFICIGNSQYVEGSPWFTAVYGQISNITELINSTVIKFTYTAPLDGEFAIIRVETQGVEIRHSPLIISIKSAEPADSPSHSFFSFHNPTFIIVYSVVCTVIVVVTIACLYSYCELRRARAKVKSQNAREQWWLNAVSANDCPAPPSTLTQNLLR
jgi:hypothetical protein